ncbi:MAG: methionyl-tRNA formyltransferase [Magnetococcales bacterium]|nr:methionyl-tRNA formyltransferase [Magnetococcales bacterium]
MAFSPWRIVFMGTPDFAVPSLERLCAGPNPVLGVFTQPDRPVGRGLKLTPSPVKQWAARQGIPVLQPPRLRSAEAVALLRDLQPDLIVVVAYGQILSPEVLAIPRHGCLNVHASLLPRWRGAAPVQRALLAGDSESGVTLMQMDAGLDTGPMLSQRRLPLTTGMTGGELHDRLAQLGAVLLQESLPDLQTGALIPTPQPDTGVTYAAKITPQDEQVDWGQPAEQIKRQIDALNPWPAAHTRLGGQTIKLLRCRLGAGTGEKGRQIAVQKEGPEIACGEGSLVVTELQPAGKRCMAAADWWRGQPTRPEDLYWGA